MGAKQCTNRGAICCTIHWDTKSSTKCWSKQGTNRSAIDCTIHSTIRDTIFGANRSAIECAIDICTNQYWRHVWAKQCTIDAWTK